MLNATEERKKKDLVCLLEWAPLCTLAYIHTYIHSTFRVGQEKIHELY